MCGNAGCNCAEGYSYSGLSHICVGKLDYIVSSGRLNCFTFWLHNEKQNVVIVVNVLITVNASMFAPAVTIDYNECASNTTCNGTGVYCVNTVGGYECECDNTGYTWDKSTKECQGTWNRGGICGSELSYTVMKVYGNRRVSSILKFV